MLTLARRVRHARPGEDVTLRNTRTADVAHTRDTATTALRFGPGPRNLAVPRAVAGYVCPTGIFLEVLVAETGAGAAAAPDPRGLLSTLPLGGPPRRIAPTARCRLCARPP